VGVVTRRDLFDGVDAGERRIGELVKRPPVVVTLGVSLRDAADIMAREGVGRLAVVSADKKTPVVGMLTRGDLLFAHRRRLDNNVPASPTLLRTRRPGPAVA
ncbi:MAG: CBS domain-containing protein, partial [Polyangiaceae bacterium]